MRRIGMIVTHVRPHFDELFAIWLLKHHGEETFAGTHTARVMFVPDENILRGRTPEECERNGMLLLGTGGGRFDEHPKNGAPRKDGECAATLVAKVLGISEKPEFKKLLEFSLKNDTLGIGSPFDLARMTNLLNSMYPDDPEKVMEWVFLGLDAKYAEQVNFFGTTAEEFARRATIHEIRSPRGEPLRLAVIESDNEQIGKYARWDHGGNAAIVIHRKRTGHTQIYTRHKDGLTLRELAQILRFEEQRAKKRIVTTDWRILAEEGAVTGAEEWYYHKGGEMLLNGSLTSPKVHPTRLSLSQLVQFVQIAMDATAFEEKRASRCAQGRCASSRDNPCPWYRWMLQRCRRTRFETYQKEKEEQERLVG